MTWQQHRFVHRELELAWQDHGPAGQRPLVALHGWRDNAASFHRMAELWPEQHILALDFPGHGLSARRHAQASYCVWEYLEDVDALLERCCPDGCDLLGHSMGGAVAALYAALYPERVRRLVLLDAVGPLATSADDAPAQLLEARRQLHSRHKARRQYYPDFDAAVAARASRGLELQAARELALRGVRQDAAGWFWDLDPRLGMKNAVSFTEAHAEAFMRRIAMPVLLVAAPGFWETKRGWFDRRLTYIPQLELHMLDGGHHQHMEALAPVVTQLVRDFLQR